MSSEPAPPTWSRSRFLLFAGLVQGGVLALALLVAYALDLPMTRLVRWNTPDCIAGLAAVLPMLAIYRFSPELRQLASDSLGDPLSRCTWYDLFGLALLAGIGEELLFRGVLYEGLVPVNPWLALIATNVAFGLLHAMSWNYLLTTTVIGFGLHALAEATGPRNLLGPMIAHGVYDFLAFLLLVRERRASAIKDRSPVSPSR